MHHLLWWWESFFASSIHIIGFDSVLGPHLDWSNREHHEGFSVINFSWKFGWFWSQSWKGSTQSQSMPAQYETAFLWSDSWSLLFPAAVVHSLFSAVPEAFSWVSHSPPPVLWLSCQSRTDWPLAEALSSWLGWHTLVLTRSPQYCLMKERLCTALLSLSFRPRHSVAVMSRLSLCSWWLLLIPTTFCTADWWLFPASSGSC